MRNSSRSTSAIRCSAFYISKPMLHQGSYGIVLSCRIAARDGTFLGIVAGFIRYTHFHEMR